MHPSMLAMPVRVLHVTTLMPSMQLFPKMEKDHRAAIEELDRLLTELGL